MEENEIVLTEESPNEALPTDFEEASAEPEIDYETLVEEDLAELRKIFPELSNIKEITELENPTRYGALRDLGLTAEEAYRATTRTRASKSDNRAHLKSSFPKAATPPKSSMSYRDMEIAKSLFSDLSDSEIQRLYKKVTK